MNDDDDDVTNLKCSRCEATILTYPGDIRASESIATPLVLDLIRQCVKHGYECPGREGGPL